MQQGKQQRGRMVNGGQYKLVQLAWPVCLHLLRLPNRLTIGLQAVQVHYEKTVFSVTCFKRLVW